jgi:hypothetical protein
MRKVAFTLVLRELFEKLCVEEEWTFWRKELANGFNYPRVLVRRIAPRFLCLYRYLYQNLK